MSRKLGGAYFARLALDYFDHPKIGALSDSAIVAHLEMIVYCRRYLTDGRVPKRIAERFASESLDELSTNDPTRPSIVVNDDGTITVHDYADAQETREEVEKKRQVNRANARGRSESLSGSLGESLSGSLGESPRSSEAIRSTEEEEEEEITLLVNPDGSTGSEGGRLTIDDKFAQWWTHWPKKVKKARARAQFPAALKQLPLEQLIAATEAWTAAFNSTGKERAFIPDPERWLRDRRWEDDLTTTQGATGTFDPESW